MSQARSALTPDALAMMDAIARSGSFAAAARAARQGALGADLQRAPARGRARRAAVRPALAPGHAHRRRPGAARRRPAPARARSTPSPTACKRVATGWETQLTIAVDDVISRTTLFELCEAFYACSAALAQGRLARQPPATPTAAGDPPAPAHRGAGRHLGGADHRPGRPGDRRRGRSRAAARRDDEGPLGRWSSCSRSRRIIRWPRPASRSTTAS